MRGFLFFVLTINIAIGQDKQFEHDIIKYPDYASVVTRFLEAHPQLYTQDPNIIQFAKKPAGWYVQHYEPTEKRIIQEELWWSVKKGYKKKVKIKGQPKPEEELARLVLEEVLYSDGKERVFNIHPYYGYVGFNDDIINILYPYKESLPDSLLYGLARAYDNSAADLLHRNFSFADTGRMFKGAYGPNGLSTEEVALYISTYEKAAQCYYQLYQRNPGFEVLVGDLYDKYSNTYVDMFLHLSISQNLQEAKKVLNKKLYHPFMLTFGRTLLTSCAPNAILFTNGDNDTYPLLYLQAIEGFRTDVRVCNLSLMNTSRYLDYLRKDLFERDAVEFTIDPALYHNKEREYLAIVDMEDEEKPMELAEAISFICDSTKRKLFSTGKQMNYFPSDSFKLTIDNNNIITNNVVPKNMEEQIVNKMEWSYSTKYLLKNTIMVLDILNANNWRRPLYFALTVGKPSFMGLEKYFQQEGMVYRLVPVEMNSEDGQTGKVEPDIAYANLMGKTNWEGHRDTTIKNMANAQRLCMNYRNSFNRLATALIEEKRNDEALKVLDRCILDFPENAVPYNFFMLPIADSYYKLGKPTVANPISTKLAERYKAEFKEAVAQKPVDRKKMETALGVMNRLNTLTNISYPQESIGPSIGLNFNDMVDISTKVAVEEMRIVPR